MMGSKDVQRLMDFDLIPGEFFTVTINVKKEDGRSVDVTSLSKALKVFPYGQRDMVIFNVDGVQVDGDKVTFKIPSSETERWNGKMEYVIELAYSNGDKNIGLGFITMV